MVDRVSGLKLELKVLVLPRPWYPAKPSPKAEFGLLKIRPILISPSNESRNWMDMINTDKTVLFILSRI